MLPTPRTQPYRRDTARMPGAALQAMLTGRQPGQLNPADFNRARAQNALQTLIQQQMRPRASADARGTFGQALPIAGGPGVAVDHWDGTAPLHPADLHQLVLAALQMQRRRVAPRGNGGAAAPPIAHI